MSREPVDACVNCQKQLYEGDNAFSYSSGEVACESCAPTYAEAAKEWQQCKVDEAENYQRFCAGLTKHVADGGSVTDKCVSPL